MVAGVPPTTSAATGQRWGIPLYTVEPACRRAPRVVDERVRRAFELVDVLRSTTSGFRPLLGDPA
jgi:4-alpha-glucanotransferase